MALFSMNNCRVDRRAIGSGI